MSDLGTQIQDEIDAIKAIPRRSETPQGEPGGPFADEYEAFADGVQAGLDAAAPDSIRDADGNLSAPYVGPSVDTDELSVTTSMVVPSVATVSDLPSDSNSTDTQVMFVESEQRYYRYEA